MEIPERACVLYPASNVSDYFEFIIEEHDAVTNNPPIRTSVNKIEYRITFEIKTWNHLELLRRETMRLL